MMEKKDHIDRLKQAAGDFKLPVDDAVWNTIESRITQAKAGSTWFKKRYLLLLIPFLSAIGYVMYDGVLKENEQKQEEDITIHPIDKFDDEDAISDALSPKSRSENAIIEGGTTIPKNKNKAPNDSKAEEEQTQLYSTEIGSKENGLIQKSNDIKRKKSIPDKTESSGSRAGFVATEKSQLSTNEETMPKPPIAAPSTREPRSMTSEGREVSSAAVEDNAVVKENLENQDGNSGKDNLVDPDNLFAEQESDDREPHEAQTESSALTAPFENKTLKTAPDSSEREAFENERVELATSPGVDSTTESSDKENDNGQNKRKFLDFFRVMPFYGYGISNRELSSNGLGELVEHKNDHESAGTTNRFGFRFNYHFKNKSFIGTGIEYASYGEHYNFQHDIVAYETDNEYQYIQFMLLYGQHIWGSRKHDISLLLGTNWSALDQAQSSWVDTEQLAVVSHNNRGLGQPFRKNTYVIFGGVEYSYRFNDRFGLHVFPIYDRFLNSVYNADTDLDQKQYSFSVNFGLSVGF